MNVAPQPQPVLDKRGEPHVRRFEEQRWLIDNIIRANGIDWDQPRSLYLSGPCGVEANADFAGIRERVKKMADIGPAFEAVARRREAKAKAAEEADRKVTARDNYFMAAVHWGAAQWPYDENNETNIAYNNKKRECYAKYAALADHRVEPVLVPFRDKAIPAWFHLPPGYQGGRVGVHLDVGEKLAAAFSAEQQIRRDVEVVAQRQVLPDHAHAELRGGGRHRRHRLPADPDRPAHRRDVPRDSPDQRGLARPVLPGKGHDLPRPQREIDPLKRRQRAKAHREPGHREFGYHAQGRALRIAGHVTIVIQFSW